MKLSVIIPVYKVEATLDRCVESVLAQQCEGMEVVLVDDGSPDASPALCDRWAARDGRVRVVHQTNGGLSDARNAGLAVATGELVTFVDSDDFLAPDTYAPLLEAMTADVDIVEYPAVLFYGSGRQTELALEEHVYDDKTDYWLRGRAYAHAYAWNKIYRRSLFAQVRFPRGKVFEDAHTLPLLLERARRVKTTCKGLYYYCDNPSGITATASGEDMESLLQAHLAHWDVTADAAYYLHVLNLQLYVCRLLGKHELIPPMTAPLRQPLPHGLRYKARLLRVLGLKRLCAAYRLWGRLKGGRR